MATAPAPDPARWRALAVVAAGVALIIIDATIVNVALPTIITDLDLRLATAEWVNTTYALVFAALLIVAGRLADLHGRRRLYLTGLVVFTAASVLAGLAPTGGLLVGARVLQGLGGAMVLPATLSIVNATFTGKERAAAFGVWGATIGGMAALGPLAGGWLTETLGWRWVFLVNIPVGLLLIALTLRLVRESRDEHAVPPADPVAAVALAGGLAALVFALIEGRTYGWWAPAERFGVAGLDWPLDGISPIPLALALAAGGVATFVAVELRRGRQGRTRLVDLELFRIASFRWGNVTALLVSLGEFGLLFAIPLYLQNVLGLSALQTGGTLAVLALGAFLTGGGAAPASARLGARGVVRLGMALEAVGLAGFALGVAPDASAWRFLVPLFVYGMGVGFATAQLTGVILADVPQAASGQASGIQSTSRQIGSALGVATLGVILATALAGNARDRLEATGVPAADAATIATAVERSGGTAIPALAAGPDGPTIGPALEAAFSDATRRTSLVAAGFILVGLGSSLLLPRR